MDTSKALYMAEFLKVRDNLGCVELPTVKSSFYNNLYNEMQKKEITEDITDTIQEIQLGQQKTIHMLKKEDQPVFFPDLPKLEPDDKPVNEVKQIKLKKEDPIINDKEDIKQIVIDPNYVAKND